MGARAEQTPSGNKIIIIGAPGLQARGVLQMAERVLDASAIPAGMGAVSVPITSGL